ncbi:hypothetical protein NA57DRAFT_77855 [Rhizodiscina lignyota]|uniref:Proteinase inhibitor, propeptide n=1 Tax=Rhizodiscina lignyota TaxID=1504668 RepID=A0A9P4M7S3_9PEZI|nr:hypothetical protein NA57DRAFT_77855 [Rhizodiscina lignyota]
MKFQLTSLFLVLLFALLATAAKAPKKSVLITYPKDTPEHILDQAKEGIKKAGGYITHEYNLIKGFAADAPAKILESVQTWGNDYHVVIEEDQIVYANDGKVH